MMDLGNVLRGLRLANGYTQQTVAQLTGVSKGMVSAYETGIRQPSLEMLVRLANLYKVSTDYLLGNAEAQNAYSLEGLTEDQTETVLRIIKDMKYANELM